MAYEKHTFTFEDCAFTNKEIIVEVFRKSTRISIGEDDIFGIENEDLKLLIDFCKKRLDEIEFDKCNILDEIPLTKFLSSNEIISNADKNKYSYIFRILSNNKIICIKNVSSGLCIDNQYSIIYNKEKNELQVLPLFIYLMDTTESILSNSKPLFSLIKTFSSEKYAIIYAKKLLDKYKQVKLFDLNNELNKIMYGS